MTLLKTYLITLAILALLMIAGTVLTMNGFVVGHTLAMISLIGFILSGAAYVFFSRKK